MTRHGRPVLLHCRILTVALLLIPLAAFAAIPIVTPQTPTEIVSGRTFRIMGPGGQMQTVPDLAISGQALVQLRAGTTAQQLEALLAATGCSVLNQYHTPGLLLLRLPAGTSVTQGTSQLQMQMVVQAASPDRLMYPFRTPNDPSYATQYMWPLIDAPQAWDVQTGSASVVVAVIDSGVDMAHEDLASRIWDNPGEIPGNAVDDDANGFVDDANGWDFFNNNNDPNPNGAGATTAEEMGTVRHGTHVAGLIGAVGDNGVGVTGHAWSCQIMPVQVFNSGSTSSAIVMGAFEYARDNGADVINMSLGGGYTETWNDPITLAYNMGITVVVAAGNDSFGDGARYFFTDQPSTWLSPVCNDGPNFIDNHVLGVGATDSSDVCAFFTNLDKSAREFVDVMAPGVNDYSTFYYNPPEGFNSRYGFMSGTSQAAPVTAGLVALIKSQFPGFGPGAIIHQIRAGSENINAQNPTNIGFMGAGRINSANTLVDQPPGPPRSVMAFDTLGDSGGSITVSWSLSLDDGRGFDDVVSYEIWRATDVGGPFGMLDTVPPGTREYLDTPVPDYTPYYYQLYAVDAGAHKTASAVTDAAMARDDIAPDAVIAGAADTLADNGGSITVTWEGYAPPADFGGYHVYRSDSSFNNIAAAGVTLLTTISNPAQKNYQDTPTVDNHDYYYAVTCFDTSLPPNERPEVTAFGPVRSNPNYAFGFPAGLSLFAIGLTMQNNELDDIFTIAGGDPVFARWNPLLSGADKYVRYVAGSSETFLRVLPGRGFWMRSTIPQPLSLSGAVATGDYPADFVAGWNQLGNPYPDHVNVTAAGTGVRVGGTFYTLAQSNTLNYARDFFWTFDTFTSSYKLISPTLPFSTQIIYKGEGFFFWAERPGQLILKNPNPTGPVQVADAPPVEQADVAWSLRLVASTDGAADTDNFLGVSTDAAAISNIVSPPPAGDGPDLYFTGDFTHAATAFVESLGAGQTWTAEVACARRSAAIKLSWPDLTALPRDRRPVLRDAVAGRSVYMRTSTGYSFTLGPDEASRSLTIEINPKAGDALAIRSLQTESVAGNVRVSYSLSTAAAVAVEVRNVAGRLIRRLGGGELLDPGAHEALWNCTATGGQRVPAGRYLITVIGQAENGQTVQAMQAVEVRR
jgi:subtilisin family serine protease